MVRSHGFQIFRVNMVSRGIVVKEEYLVMFVLC